MSFHSSYAWYRETFMYFKWVTRINKRISKLILEPANYSFCVCIQTRSALVRKGLFWDFFSTFTGMKYQNSINSCTNIPQLQLFLLLFFFESHWNTLWIKQKQQKRTHGNTEQNINFYIYNNCKRGSEKHFKAIVLWTTVTEKGYINSAKTNTSLLSLCIVSSQSDKALGNFLKCLP